MKFLAFIIGLFFLMPAAIAEEKTSALDSLKGAVELDVSPTDLKDKDLQGKRVVVAFFASWCPPCIDEFHQATKARDGLNGTDFTMIGVNLFEAWGGKKDPARMARFIAKTKPWFPLIDGTEAISEAFGGIDRIPTLVVFDEQGKEVWRFVHARGATKTHATAKEIMAALE